MDNCFIGSVGELLPGMGEFYVFEWSFCKKDNVRDIQFKDQAVTTPADPSAGSKTRRGLGETVVKDEGQLLLGRVRPVGQGDGGSGRGVDDGGFYQGRGDFDRFREVFNR